MNQQQSIVIAGLTIDEPLSRFVGEELLPGTAWSESQFWQVFSELLQESSPRASALLAKRDRLQNQLDDWHTQHRGASFDASAYQAFLEKIGYLLPQVSECQVQCTGVDAEIAVVAGPQLVVPLSNARYAINAANARWGSLFDALYGSDVIPGRKSAEYDPARGRAVIEYVDQFLDRAVPLSGAQHADVSEYRLQNEQLLAVTGNGSQHVLQDAEQFIGHRRAEAGSLTLLLKNHGLHIELNIDSQHPVGQTHHAGVSDVVLESALTTIADCEDSVAAVDASDKVQVYRHWLGLMQGDLTANFSKGGRVQSRALSADREYAGADGAVRLSGTSLLLVRNVGLHMSTDIVRDQQGQAVPEGLLDALVTVVAASHNLHGRSAHRNSVVNSIYVVKPKLHGPDEVRLVVDQFDSLEQKLALPKNTVKLGIMDEERRTSLNLAACLEAAKERVIFINTGFLDRTGDEIHSCMQAGPVLRKVGMKKATWMQTYETQNVAVGLSCGLRGKGQIGKGMWAQPDAMAAMLKEKIDQLKSGANCAWVPSPTAATLHAMHYHDVDVATVQAGLLDLPNPDRLRMLRVPVADASVWSRDDIQQELDNNCQGLLGYVARWIQQGVGCSKVLDSQGVGLMEDRATLRISSQHVANWMLHGVITKQQVDESLRRMMRIVNEQNATDSEFQSLTADGPEVQAAHALINEALTSPNGYTEVVLHQWRRLRKLL